jgi:hypothetical protein
MLDDLLTIDRLSQVIEHAIAPAFLLGAVAGFVAIIMTRIENLSRRMEGTSKEKAAGMARRLFLLHRAAFFGLCASIFAAVFVIISFVLGFLNVTHVYGMGILFLFRSAKPRTLARSSPLSGEAPAASPLDGNNHGRW